MSARAKDGYRGHGDHGHGGEHHTHPKHTAHKLVKEHTSGSRDQGRPFHGGPHDEAQHTHEGAMPHGSGATQYAGSLNDTGDSVAQSGQGMEAPDEAGEASPYPCPPEGEPE